MNLRPSDPKCPSCNAVLPPSQDAARLARAVDEAKTLRANIVSLSASVKRASEQEDDKRAELSRRAQRAEADAIEARKDAAAARRDLKAIRDLLGAWLSELRAEDAAEIAAHADPVVVEPTP